MKCLLIWQAVNLFLYRCPAMVPPITNCTTIHEGTYDAEFMTMCSAPIETPETTTQTPMEPARTSSAGSSPSPQSGNELSPSPQRVETTTRIPVEGTMSPSPSSESDHSYTIKTTPSPFRSNPTTKSRASSPSPAASVVPDTDEPFIPRNASKQVIRTETKIIERSDSPLVIVALVVSIVSVVVCITGVLHMRHRHADMVRRKSVGPSQVQLQQGEDTIDKSMQENEIRMNRVRKAMQDHRTAASRAAPTPAVYRTNKPSVMGKPGDAPTALTLPKRAVPTPAVDRTNKQSVPVKTGDAPTALTPPKRAAPTPAVDRTNKQSVRNVSNVARMIHKFDPTSVK